MYSELTEQIKTLAPQFKEDAESSKVVLERLCRIATWNGASNSRELAGLVTEQYTDARSLIRTTAGLLDSADRFLIQATNFVTDRLATEDPILAQFDGEFIAALDKAQQLLEAK